MKTFITVLTTALITTILFLVLGKEGMLGTGSPTPVQCPQGTTIVKTVETCTPPATGTQETGALMEVFSCTSGGVVAEQVTKLLSNHYISTSCFAPDGNTYPDGTKLTFYATAKITAENPQPACDKVEKTCTSGQFVSKGTGADTYHHLSCRRIDPSDTSTAYCSYNNDTYLPGEVVYKYAKSAVSLDQECKQVVAVCNGHGQRWTATTGYAAMNCSFARVFSPSYLEKNKGSIIDNETKLPKPETVACMSNSWNSCATPRGTRVDHGDAFVSFKDSAVALDESCTAKSVICNNGKWANGATPYANQSCKKELPADCVINTTKFYHDTTNTLYKKTTNKDGTVSCEPQARYCFDGILSGSTEYKWRSCTWTLVEPAGTTGKATTVNTATPPTLINKPTTTPSVVSPTATYNPNKEPNCASPFGGAPRAPGKQGTAYKSATASYSQWCSAESIVCAWGSIRWGTAAAPGEVVTASLSSSCKVLPPQDCESACGTIEHGKQGTTFSDDEIPFGNGEVCSDKQITSTCNDGTLSPSAGKYCSCKISAPVACTAPDGKKVASDQTLTLYQYPEVQALPGDGSDTCVRQWRKCINGDRYDRDGNEASFTYKYTSCKVLLPDEDADQWGDGVPQT